MLKIGISNRIALIHQFRDEPLVPSEEVQELPAGEAEDEGIPVDGDALVHRAGLLRVPERRGDAGGAGGGVGVAAAEREAEALARSAAARRFRFAWNVLLAA